MLVLGLVTGVDGCKTIRIQATVVIDGEEGPWSHWALQGFSTKQVRPKQTNNDDPPWQSDHYVQFQHQSRQSHVQKVPT